MRQAPQHHKNKQQDLLQILLRVDVAVKDGKIDEAAELLASIEVQHPESPTLEALRHRLELFEGVRQHLSADDEANDVHSLPPYMMSALHHLVVMVGNELAGDKSGDNQRNNISSLLDQAKGTAGSSSFGALQFLAQAYTVSPSHHEIHIAEEKLRSQLAERRVSRDEELRKEEEQRRGRSKLFDKDSSERQQLARKSIEEASRQAREHKVRHSLHKVRDFLRGGKHEDALGQLAVVQALDPSNENVQSLHQHILGQMKKEKDGKPGGEDARVAEGFKALIRKEIDRAELFLKEQKFDEAFRVLTRAYRINPVSEQVIACENKIIAAQQQAFQMNEQKRLKAEEEQRRREDAVVNHLTDAEMAAKLKKDLGDSEAYHKEEKGLVLLTLARAYGYLQQDLVHEAKAELGGLLSQALPERFTTDISELIDSVSESAVSPEVEKQEVSTPEPPENEVLSTEAKTILSLYSPEAMKISGPGKQIEEPPHHVITDSPAEFAVEEPQELTLEEVEREENLAVEMSLKEAHECLDREELPEAMAWVEYALRFAGNRPDVIKLRDELDRKFSEWETKKANQQGPLVIHLHLSNAFDLLIQGKTTEALQEVESALAIEPNHQEALSLRTQITKKM